MPLPPSTVRRAVTVLILASGTGLTGAVRPARAQVCATATITVQGTPTAKSQCEPALDQFPPDCVPEGAGRDGNSVAVEVCVPRPPV